MVPEDRRIAADEADAGEDIVGARDILGDRLRARPDEAGQDHPEDPEQNHHRVGEMRRNRVGKTAERRPCNGRDLRRSAGYGGGALERALRRDRRQQRSSGRTFEGPGNAEHEGRHENLNFADQAEIGDDAEISAVAASTSWQSWTTRLRSKRSAAWPATNTSSAVGRNCTRPTMPRSKAEPVRS